MRLAPLTILFSLSFLTIASAGPTYEPEHSQDPWLPGNGQSESGLRSPPAAPPGSVQVNVDANGNNIVGDAANEPTLAIDPTNPQHMVIGWRQFDTISSNFRQAGYAYTTDGGAHWTFPGVLNPGMGRSDPCLAADNAGRIFYDSLQVDTFCQDVFETSSGGLSWTSGVPAHGGDKNWMVIDRTNGTGAGFLYSIWQSAAPCDSGQFTRSTDHGVTWASPTAVSGAPRFGIMDVGPDGTLFATGVSPTSFATFIVSKSTNAQNGAVTPTFSSVSGNLLGGSQVISAGPNPGGLLGQVYIAANPNNASHVYLLCSVGSNSSNPTNVRFARSTNGGTTWAASVKVNDDSVAGKWHWFGTMSVAPNGRLDVVWNDTRDDPNNMLSRLYYSFSNDEGTTWSPNVALTPQWNSQIGWPNQNKIGDYYHMISDNAGASLAYAATFNGEQDVYFMRIVNCTPPTVNPINNASTLCGVSFTSGTPSLGSGTTPVTWSLGAGSPSGMTINPATGVLSWPSPSTTGSPFTITTTATNSCGSGSQNWTLTVNPNPPTIGASNAAAICGASFTSAAPTVSGGVSPLSWSLVSGPSGMTINSATGAVSWPNPVTTGSPFTISIQAASNGHCGSASTSWQLSVVAGDFTGD
ncbi:MAG TPA: putative Ig domain-containing protein, partial [Phycisphaerae bacterium]|nr:putative Ig domain-containing protein [Phycisphaerae bacterium]